jgi:nucleoside-diphosphate-sugar epimerase
VSYVLITGGGGSLGTKLALMLREEGHTIKIFDLPGLDYGSLEDKPGIEIFTGDIAHRETLLDAASGVDTVIHLAALLPPVTEEDWRRTESVNVVGTENLIKAVGGQNRDAHFIFSSSVAVYGATIDENEALSADHDPGPNDFYSKSKVLAEKLAMGAGVSYTVLRISGIAIPAFLEPPAVWPFMRDQRMEFISRDDVVTALFNCVGNEAVRDKVFNIAGGETWQMMGYEYVTALFDLMGVPAEEAVYLETPGWFHWYQTDESQAALTYQNTTFQDFLDRLAKAIQELLG